MSLIYSIRMARVSPEIVDDRIAEVVQELRRTGFLEGTALEARASAIGVDPYSLLLGILIGVAATLVLGLFTMEIWLPKVISRVTGKALAETRKTVMEVLRR